MDTTTEIIIWLYLQGAERAIQSLPSEIDDEFYMMGYRSGRSCRTVAILIVGHLANVFQELYARWRFQSRLPEFIEAMRVRHF